MKRFAAIALFAGAVLVSTHMLAPAEQPASSARELTAGRAALTQAAAAADQVDQINTEVQRLRERLAEQRTYPPPTRDPFRYGARPAPRPDAPAVTPPVAVEVPKPVLPQLIAITTSTEQGAAARTAVLAIGDNVQLVKPGDTFASFVVRSIGLDAVELVEPSTGHIATVSLR
jgi:hypothetical protein